jgi:hypothetical protein
MNFRGDFLINHSNKISGKTVLECAAGAGHISENIIELKPSIFYMTDYPGSPMFKCNPYITQANILTPNIDILRDLPEFYKNNVIDTVICTGYLYHTCHPAWAIEQMLLGRPKYFYLETDCYSNAPIGNSSITSYGTEELNVIGNHNRYPGSIAYHIGLPAIVIEEMVGTLNYKTIDKFDRAVIYKDSLPDFSNNPDYIQGFNYEFWKNTTGWWFERNE